MKTIFITQITLLFFLVPGVNWGQMVTVAGYINNSTSGKAMSNVSVYDAASGIGTITNQNGYYRLVLQSNDVKLKFSSNGFKEHTKQFALAADTTLTVKLQPITELKRKQKKASELPANSVRKNEDLARK